MPGVVKSVLVSFDGATTKMKFLAIEEVPVDTLIGMTGLGRPQVSIHLGGQYADFKIDGREIRI